MDILAGNAYVPGMFARVLMILAILAIAVVSPIGAAHASRMSLMEADHAAHRGAMMHASAEAQPTCEGSEHCGPADVAMCEFSCAGLPICLVNPGVEPGRTFGSADHDFPAGAGHVGLAPGLNERPPKLRLL